MVIIWYSRKEGKKISMKSNVFSRNTRRFPIICLLWWFVFVVMFISHFYGNGKDAFHTRIVVFFSLFKAVESKQLKQEMRVITAMKMKGLWCAWIVKSLELKIFHFFSCKNSRQKKERSSFFFNESVERFDWKEGKWCIIRLKTIDE